MKRWRCPDCGAVHTTRPADYLPGMQYPRDIQVASLETKLSGRPFVNVVSRQVQQHWLNAFLHRCRKNENWGDPLFYMKSLRERGRLYPTTRRIYRESFSCGGVPYLPFALTVTPYPGSLE